MRKMLKSGNQGTIFLSCCRSQENSGRKINRLVIGAPTNFKHIMHMGTSVTNTSMTSSILSDSAPNADITENSFLEHFKLIDLSEAMAVHRDKHNSQKIHPAYSEPFLERNTRRPIDDVPASSEITAPRNSPPPSVPAKPPRRMANRHPFLTAGPLPPPPPPPQFVSIA